MSRLRIPASVPVPPSPLAGNRVRVLSQGLTVAERTAVLQGEIRTTLAPNGWMLIEDTDQGQDRNRRGLADGPVFTGRHRFFRFSAT